jgi:hypothetical protein
VRATIAAVPGTQRDALGARAAILIAGLTAGGCLSAVPIDTAADIRVDTSLLGSWNCQTPLAEPETEKSELAITAADASTLLVKVTEPDQEPQQYEAYASSVAGSTLFNIKAAKGTLPLEPLEWVFVRAILSGNKLRIQTLNYDKPLKVASSAALRDLIESDSKKPGFFLDFAICERRKGKKDGLE